MRGETNLPSHLTIPCLKYSDSLKEQLILWPRHKHACWQPTGSIKEVSYDVGKISLAW
jgi:hypothetical protein